MSRRREVTLACCLAIVAVVLVILVGTKPESADLADTARRGPLLDPDAPLTADGAQATGETGRRDAPSAALAGSGAGAGSDTEAVEITVVDRGGEPIPWIPIRLDRYEGGRLQGGTRTATEADGRKCFDDVRVGEANLTVLSGSSSISRAIVEQDVPITKSPMVVRARRVRRVRRRFVDAETGRPLHISHSTCWNPLTGSDQSVDHDHDERVDYDIEDRSGRSGFRTRATPPEGYVTWDDELWSQPLSAYADEVAVMVPLRREAIVRLTVLAHDGTPATDAVVKKFVAAGSKWAKPSVMRDGFGTFHVKGIPYFRREALGIWVEIPGTTAFEMFRTHMPADPSEPIVGTIRLPKPEPTGGPFEGPTRNGAIGIGGGHGDAFRGRLAGPRGAAEVRVARADGTPAVGALVRIAGQSAKADARGVARLRNVPAGDQAILIEQRGLLPIRGSITILDQGVAKLILQEGRGARIELQVVDDLGEPLPFARFVASIPGDRAQYIDEQRGVQRVDRYVDHRGRRKLERVDPRVTRIRVYWASRAKTVEVDLSHGKRVPLRVVLAAPSGASSR